MRRPVGSVRPKSQLVAQLEIADRSPSCARRGSWPGCVSNVCRAASDNERRSYQPRPAGAVVKLAVEGGGGRGDAFQRDGDVGRPAAAGQSAGVISRCVMVIDSRRRRARGGWWAKRSGTFSGAQSGARDDGRVGDGRPHFGHEPS
jgi:hypothetical protein